MGPTYRLVTIVLLAEVTMIAFETMAVSTAMPAVAQDLDAVRNYGLVFAFMLSAQLFASVVAGAWCEARGPLAPMSTGLALFGLGSVLAGAATTFPLLLAARVVAGLGGGLMVVSLYVAIGRAYPEVLRAKVFGWISTAWVLPSVVGPVIAAWLTETLAWRWVFWCVVPGALVCLALVLQRRAQFTTPRTVDRSADSVRRGRVAARKPVLLGLGVALGAGIFQWASQELWPFAWLTWVATVLGLGVALACARNLLPPGTFRMRRGLPSVMVSRFLFPGAWNGALAFVPLMVVQERGASATVAGLMLCVGSIGWSVGAVLQGHESFAPHRDRLLSTGAATLAAGLLLLAAVPLWDLPELVIPVAVAVMGLGIGLAMSVMSVLSLDLSPAKEHGRVSAALQLSDAFGAAVGIAITGALFAALHRGAGQDGAVYAGIWAGCALLAALAVVSGRRVRV